MKALNVLRRDQRGYTLTELLITVAILGLVMAAVLAVQMTSNTMFLRGENQAEAQQGARAAMLMEEDLRMAGYGCPALGCNAPATTAAGCPAPAAGQLMINAASASCVDFWADTLNASTTLTAAVAVGATALPVADARGIANTNTVYLNNGGTWESRTVTNSTNSAPGTLTVAALTNAYPQGVQVGRPRRIVYQFSGSALSKDAGDGNGLQTLATGVQSLAFTFFNTLDAQIGAGVLSANLANIRRIQISTTTQSATSAAGPSTYTINTNVRPRNL